MPTYLITYHGGGEMPAAPEARQQMAAAFGAWAASVGGAMIDRGAPLGRIKTVTADRVTDGAMSGSASGYTLLSAADLDAAVKLVQSHPFLKRGGSLQVSEAVDLGVNSGDGDGWRGRARMRACGEWQSLWGCWRWRPIWGSGCR